MNIISKTRRKCAFLVLLMCIMTPTDVVAQELIRFQPYLGGGAGLSNQQLKSNLQLGVNIQLPLPFGEKKNWYVQSGVGLGDFRRSYEIAEKFAMSWSDRGIRYSYIHVPLQFGYTFRLSWIMTLQVDIGPYVNFGSSGRICVMSYTENPYTESYYYRYYNPFNDEGFLKKREAGIGLNVRLCVGKFRYAAGFVAISYQHGLTNLVKDNAASIPSYQEYERLISPLGGKMHNRLLAITLGASISIR